MTSKELIEQIRLCSRRTDSYPTAKQQLMLYKLYERNAFTDAETFWLSLQEENQAVSRATVYRVLKHLTAKGYLKERNIIVCSAIACAFNRQLFRVAEVVTLICSST